MKFCSRAFPKCHTPIELRKNYEPQWHFFNFVLTTGWVSQLCMIRSWWQAKLNSGSQLFFLLMHTHTSVKNLNRNLHFFSMLEVHQLLTDCFLNSVWRPSLLWFLSADFSAMGDHVVIDMSSSVSSKSVIKLSWQRSPLPAPPSIEHFVSFRLRNQSWIDNPAPSQIWNFVILSVLDSGTTLRMVMRGDYCEPYVAGASFKEPSPRKSFWSSQTKAWGNRAWLITKANLWGDGSYSNTICGWIQKWKFIWKCLAGSECARIASSKSFFAH